MNQKSDEVSIRNNGSENSYLDGLLDIFLFEIQKLRYLTSVTPSVTRKTGSSVRNPKIAGTDLVAQNPATQLKTVEREADNIS